MASVAPLTDPKSQVSVISRRVTNVNYNLGDSRVYNVSSVVKLREERANHTDVGQLGAFRVEHTTLKTMNWKASLPSNIASSMNASIPYVVSGPKVVLSEERNLTVVFGEEQSESQVMAYEMNVTIPPRKKVIVSVTATRAHCDVPFTCEVADTLNNGTIQVYSKNDGLFTGSNEFDVNTSVTEEDL